MSRPRGSTRARREFLDLLDKLRREGLMQSVLLSSHILADIEESAQHIAFIDRGEIVAFERKEVYLGRWQLIRVVNGEKARSLLDGLPGKAGDFRRGGEFYLLSRSTPEELVPYLSEKLGDGGWSLEKPTLESVFLALVGRESNANNHCINTKRS